jgi:hypothetical protein
MSNISTPPVGSSLGSSSSNSARGQVSSPSTEHLQEKYLKMAEMLLNTFAKYEIAFIQKNESPFSNPNERAAAYFALIEIFIEQKLWTQVDNYYKLSIDRHVWEVADKNNNYIPSLKRLIDNLNNIHRPRESRVMAQVVQVVPMEEEKKIFFYR